MSRIDDKFNELRKIGKKALITFITSGYPDLDFTADIVKEMERQGADIIELGIPYSDPIAEGPAIQKANVRALINGVRINHAMKAVSRIRKDVNVPLVYLLYYNCILQYGADRFFQDCVTSGIDGVIIPDLPYEERSEIDSIASAYPVDIISMVSPTSRERIEQIAANARGFLYCVSSLGVTGMRSEFNTDFREFFSYIDKASTIPKALGFGISTPEQIRQMKGYCDGLIVGSAIVRLAEESSTRDEAITNIGSFVRLLRKAMDE